MQYIGLFFPDIRISELKTNENLFGRAGCCVNIVSFMNLSSYDTIRIQTSSEEQNDKQQHDGKSKKNAHA